MGICIYLSFGKQQLPLSRRANSFTDQCSLPTRLYLLVHLSIPTFFFFFTTPFLLVMPLFLYLYCSIFMAMLHILMQVENKGNKKTGPKIPQKPYGFGLSDKTKDIYCIGNLFLYLYVIQSLGLCLTCFRPLHKLVALNPEAYERPGIPFVVLHSYHISLLFVLTAQ